MSLETLSETKYIIQVCQLITNGSNKNISPKHLKQYSWYTESIFVTCYNAIPSFSPSICHTLQVDKSREIAGFLSLNSPKKDHSNLLPRANPKNQEFHRPFLYDPTFRLQLPERIGGGGERGWNGHRTHDSVGHLPAWPTPNFTLAQREAGRHQEYLGNGLTPIGKHS